MAYADPTDTSADEVVIKDKGILGGEPVFKGTRIPVRGIADMLSAGAAPEEILSGYPTLTARMLDLACVWAAAHPSRGRPKRLMDFGLTVKSSRRQALNSDSLPKRSE